MLMVFADLREVLQIDQARDDGQEDIRSMQLVLSIIVHSKYDSLDCRIDLSVSMASIIESIMKQTEY